MRRQISILLAALLLLTLLVGCGGSGSAKPAAAEYNGYASLSAISAFSSGMVFCFGIVHDLLLMGWIG